MTSLILDRPGIGRVSIRIDVLPCINDEPILSKEVRVNAKQLEQLLVFKLLNTTAEALEAQR